MEKNRNNPVSEKELAKTTDYSLLLNGKKCIRYSHIQKFISYGINLVC
jgi:hypothetical protein